MKCTGELYTDLKIENPEVKTGHSHLIDDDSVKVEKALCTMKERSKTGLSKPLMRQKCLCWTVTLERRCQWKTMLKEL